MTANQVFVLIFVGVTLLGVLIVGLALQSPHYGGYPPGNGGMP